jgi:hypothetical protein
MFQQVIAITRGSWFPQKLPNQSIKYKYYVQLIYIYINCT